MKVQAIEAHKIITFPVAADTGNFIGKQIMAGQVSPKKIPPEVSQQVSDSREVVEEALKIVNRTMESYSTELRFAMDDESKEMVVKVIDTRDNSVVRQIPAEHVLKMVAHIKEMLGTVIDKFI